MKINYITTITEFISQSDLEEFLRKNHLEFEKEPLPLWNWDVPEPKVIAYQEPWLGSVLGAIFSYEMDAPRPVLSKPNCIEEITYPLKRGANLIVCPLRLSYSDSYWTNTG